MIRGSNPAESTDVRLLCLCAVKAAVSVTSRSFGRRNPVSLVSLNVCDQKSYSSPVTGLQWPRAFQEVKVPRFHEKGTGWS
jgi:hypothetical protein